MKLPAKFLENLPIPELEIADFISALNTPAKNSIRLNPSKAKIFVDAKPVPWCDFGFYLDERPRYTSDPAFHAGAYYPQEASSMFISHIIRQLRKENDLDLVLDLCAAPGGKTTLLLSELPQTTLVHANEVIRSRVGRLSENLTKWGHPNIVITNNDPSQFSDLSGFYDLILVDAPCSGEGLFRKQIDAHQQWSEQNVNLCSARQKRILSDIWPSLKDGGYLVYSTCTYNRMENEENLKWIDSQNDVEFVNIECNEFDGIICIDEGIKGYRFMPHKINGEGFFCSVIRKLGKTQEFRPKKQKITLSKFQESNSNLELYANQENEIFVIDPHHHEKVQAISNFLKCISPGFPVGKAFKGNIKLNHGKSQLIGNVEQKSINLDLRDALNFLSKLDIPYRSEEGEVLVSYEDFSLGFGKCDSKRIISQYPKNWRVLSSKPVMYTKIVEHI